MPNGHCMRCGKPIIQGVKPHYCETCLKELGLEYTEDTKKRLKDLKKDQ